MPNQYRKDGRKLNTDPLRKIVGEKIFDEWDREDWIETPDGWITGIPHEELECGHQGQSVMNRGEWFGPGYTNSRRCAECGKEVSDGR